MKKVVISGYHGYNNSGDEAILVAMIKNIKKMYKDIDIIALSYIPEQTKEMYNIDTIYRFDYKAIKKALKTSDLLISGGGSLIQDLTSSRSLLYYLAIILMAKFYKKDVMLYGNGIGPVNKRANRYLVKKIINKVNLITLRESSSKLVLDKLGVNKPDIYIAADPVFTLESIDEKEAQKILVKECIPIDKPLVGISIRNWKHEENYVEKIARLSDKLIEKGNNVLFIPMQFPKDVDISNTILSKMNNKGYVLKANYQSFEILGVVNYLSIVISMRLHMLIYAAIKNKPMIGIIYDPKVKAYLQEIDMPALENIDDLDVNSILDIFDDINLNYKKYEEKIAIKTKMLKEKASLNNKYLEELLIKK